MKKSTIISSLALMSVLIGSVSGATVGVIDNDAPITAIYGLGNPNGGYVSATAPNAEVGLRFKQRFTTNLGSTVGTGVFTFPASGLQINIEFSAGSFNDDMLSDYKYILQLDTDPGVGQTFITYDVLLAHADNSYGISGFMGTPNGGGVEGPAYPTLATTNNLAQNSQLINWINGAFNSSVDGTYDATLTASHIGGPSDGQVAASVATQLVIGTGAVPEPSAAMLAGLATLGLMTRRKR